MKLIDRIGLNWKSKLIDNVKKYGHAYPDFKGTVHLFTPTLFFKDAVSRNILEEASVLSLVAPNVKIYAENPIGDLAEFTHSWEDFLQSYNSKTDVLLYHYSIGTRTFEQTIHLPIQKHLVYFGITPPKLLMSASVETAELCKMGIDGLKEVSRFGTWVANSPFTMGELEAHQPDHEKKFLLPPFLSVDKWDEISPVRSDRLKSFFPEDRKYKTLFYLGRRTPSKNVEELVHILKEISALGDYRLFIAGGGAVPTYHQQVMDVAIGYGIADKVQALDEPSDEELKYLYLNTHALVTSSLHEGFCLPLVEAMKLKLPSFVPDNTAMPQTLGGNCKFIVLGDPAGSANMIHETLNNPTALKSYVDKQHQHYLQYYTDAATTRSYFKFFDQILKL